MQSQARALKVGRSSFFPYIYSLNEILMNEQSKTREELVKELQKLQRENNELKASYENYIAESKKTEGALLQEQYLLSAIMENIPDHIYFKDLESRFFRNSRAHVLSFGFIDPLDLLGKSDFDFFVNEVAQRQYDDEQEIIRTGLSINKEEFTVRNDNSVNWYQSTKMPLRNKEGSVVGTFGISRDITERKLAEEEIKHKNNELQFVNAEKDKLFSIIAHDLLSPFNIFLNYTRIMEDELTSMPQEQIIKFIHMMSVSATNLYRLLENLLEWSRMQRGLIIVKPSSLLLKPAVSASLELVTESANNKKIEVSMNIDEDLVVLTDEKMLDGILRNLCTNAVKFTPQGGRIEVSAKSLDDGFIEISVKDTGIGMPQYMIDSLFKMDANTSRKGTDGEPSTGLGLILCKEFVEKQGGRLWVESEEEKGSTFCFTVPCSPIQ